MQPFIFNQQIREEYKSYIATTFPIKNPDLAARFDAQIISNHLIWKGPYISLSSEFKEGQTITALHQQGLLHDEMLHIFNNWQLRYHQELAFHAISNQNNTVVATGTGSGKTEAFLIPIIDYCLKHRGVTGTKALLMYPMNALANDQLDRIKKLLKGSGVTFGIYTGTTPTEGGDNGGIAEFITSRKEIQRKKPDILLTNYSMLELLLTRREDKVLFKEKQLQFLVLDEVHTYTGVLGTEVAALIRRLKAHTGSVGKLTCIGTSATIEKGEGNDPKVKICGFAHNLFGEAFSVDHVVEEHYKPQVKNERQYDPAAPKSFDYGCLKILLDSPSKEFIEKSLEQLCGILMKGDDGQISLIKTLKSNRFFTLLEQELQSPKSVEELITTVKSHFPTRSTLSDAEIVHEIEAYITIASLITNEYDERLILPKLHNFYRGLNNIQLCSNAGCHTFTEQGADTCPACHSQTLTFETCRTCGEDFFRARYEEETDFREMIFVQLKPTDTFDADKQTLHLTYNMDLYSNDLGKNQMVNGCFCPQCKALTIQNKHCNDVCINTECNGIMKPVLVVVGNKNTLGTITNCPSCGDYVNAGRDIVTPLTTFQAPTISMLSKSMFDHLDEHERRMLIFADNRQDTAYQAGYINDKINEFIIRQLIYQVVSENEGMPLDKLGAEVYSSAMSQGLENKYQNEYERQQKIRQYDFLCFETFCTNKGARTSLEGLGLIQISYEQLERVKSNPLYSDMLSISALSEENLFAFIASVINILRYQQAVDYPLYQWKRFKGNKKFVELRDKIEDKDFKLPKDNYFTPRGLIKEQRSAPEERNFKTINLYNEGGAVSTLQSFANKIMSDSQRAKDTLDLLKQLLIDENIVSLQMVGGSDNDRTNVYQLDPAFITLSTTHDVYKCDRCLQKSSFNPSGKCTKYRCEGELQLFILDNKNYYAQIYTNNQANRIKSAEHSGQISAKQREQYEERFKSGDINLLVCTPTMELGVDIGDLPTVFMMNTPPKPANYAQRAGRAGRGERMFSVGTYSSLSPHDSYYYNNPAEMIRGEITTPIFRLDNPTIIKRHIRSIALEKVDASFPMFLIEMLDGTALKENLDVFEEIRQKRNELIEQICEVFKQSEIGWISKESVGAILDQFVNDLRMSLQPFFTTLNNMYVRFTKLHQLLGDPLQRIDAGQKKSLEFERNRIREKIYKMIEDPSESYSMKVLAQYGFLPSYAFPTNMLQLDSYDFETAIQRDKDIGINEFAPGNIVYVGGNKYEVSYIGLDNSKEEKFARYKVCKKCGHKMFDDIEFTELCEQCNSEQLDEKYYIEPHVLYARRFSAIKASEEIRKRKRYNVSKQCIDSTNAKLLSNINGGMLIFQKNSEIVSSNYGIYSDEGEAIGFAFCRKCGFSADLSSKKAHDRSLEEHSRSSCDGSFEYNVDLISRIYADSITMQLTLPQESGKEFLTTLLHSYLIAASVYFETDNNELRGFIQEVNSPSQDDVYKIVIYDSTLGGSGILQEFLEEFDAISKKALQILEECSCDKACYKCLKTYFNQRDHNVMDKQLVIETLRQFAEMGSTQVQEITLDDFKTINKPFTQDEFTELMFFAEGEESPIEKILREAIEASDLPRPELQFSMLENERLITKPDFAYVDRKIAIYADGYLYHKSKESFERDRNIDRWLQRNGWKTLRFPGGLIYRNVQICIADIKKFLSL